MNNPLSKICVSCNRAKCLSLYPKNGLFKDGLLNKCKLCKSAAAKGYYAKNRVRIAAHVRYHTSRNKEKVRNRSYKKRFGITLEQYNLLLARQGGVCAICGEDEVFRANSGSRIKHLAVDHCHESGRIRGLLCGRCNTAIGGFKDDLFLIGRAMEYLVEKRAQ